MNSASHYRRVLKFPYPQIHLHSVSLPEIAPVYFLLHEHSGLRLTAFLCPHLLYTSYLPAVYFLSQHHVEIAFANDKNSGYFLELNII